MGRRLAVPADCEITRKSANFAIVRSLHDIPRRLGTTMVLLWLACLLPHCSEGPGRPAPAKRNSTERSSRQESRKRRILFFGDSLTAGYGLEDPSDGFTAVLSRRIDSLGWEWEVVNAGLSGETSAGGDGRIDWVLQQPVDVFVLELGANDGLRGIPVEETTRNLQSIIDKVLKANPDVRLVMAGMQAPPNMGSEFTDQFRIIFPEVARRNDMVLIPFLLEGVAGEPALNQPDGIHPTPEGHRIVAENVWKALLPLIEPVKGS
jgi:acyl-CoA thioesterase-1